MWQLALPTYPYNVKKTGNRWMIFDSLRRKFVTLTPEEWVRQHYLHYLINVKNYPSALIAVEQQIVVNGQSKRCDAVLYDTTMNPVAIFEFKAPHVPISQHTFDQAAVYNSSLQLKYFFVSNGIDHFFAEVDPIEKNYRITNSLPDYLMFSKMIGKSR